MSLFSFFGGPVNQKPVRRNAQPLKRDVRPTMEALDTRIMPTKIAGGCAPSPCTVKVTNDCKTKVDHGTANKGSAAKCDNGNHKGSNKASAVKTNNGSHKGSNKGTATKCDNGNNKGSNKS